VDGGDDGLGVHAPSRDDPVVRAASVVIGGPAGPRLASATGFWRPAPVLALLGCLMLSFGVVQKQHCRAQGWSSPDQFWHACYSDIPVLYGSAALGASDRPGLGQALGTLGQPPLVGALMWITSAFVPASSPAAPRQFFDLSVVLLAVLLAIAVAAVALTAGRRAWDAGHLALSPVLITAGLISYQLLAVALTAVALFALSRRRPVVGGLLLGLAMVSAPQVTVVGLAVVILLSRYLRTAAGAAFAAAAIGSWFAVRVLLLPGFTGGLIAAWNSWRVSAPGYGSLWLAPQLLGESGPSPAASWPGRLVQALFGWIFQAGPLGGTTTSIMALVLLGGLVAGALWLTVRADPVTNDGIEIQALPESASDPWLSMPPGPPVPLMSPASRSVPWASAGLPDAGGLSRFITAKVAPLSLALLAAVLLAAKQLPVQVSLLLLPLIALSGLRWRDHLIWAGTELIYFVGIWLYIAGETTPTRGLPAVFYLILLLARLGGIAWIGVQGIRRYREAAAPGGAVVVAGDEPFGGRYPVSQESFHANVPGVGADANVSDNVLRVIES
jgi:hypothetical protein